ncbi:hypothetical protein [Kitasatospora sp. NPDC057500]|uniref:hypothetical protein n=1 Tax=Kitasatospora sp. NPDC057500 TaxID=3346151 RepID=UPI0036BA6D6A
MAFAELGREAARSQLLTVMPTTVADGALGILGEPTAAAERQVDPDVERLLGARPRPFAAWAHRNAAAFR